MKRKGSIAVYIEPWHSDILDFINLKKNHGKEELRARDLFLALWIPDLFMERVESNSHWTLFDPAEVPGLIDAIDSKENKMFTKLYEQYESEGKGNRIEARDLWLQILENQIETGVPFILFKDAANNKSNQKNLGTIKSSNLCTEIIQYTSPEETAVCNLASIALPKFVVYPQNKSKVLDKSLRSFDFQKLYDVTYQATVNLNRVIDVNWYPTPETKNSNLKHRPIGLGVQGLADLFAILGLPFEDELAKKLNEEIFETMYFAAMTASKDMAKKSYKDEVKRLKDLDSNLVIDKRFGAYSSFNGSPLSEGIFQFDMWDVKSEGLSGRWDWVSLRKEVMTYGVTNSLLLSPMPTASTAQILGNNECFEPFTSNIYKRNVLSGEFVIVNKHLVLDLINLGLWNDDIRVMMIKENGSIQNIPQIPQNIKDVYKTVWEMKLSNLIDMSADRGKFICQSQSLNLFMRDANVAKLNKALFYGWKKGLKTGMYYLRSNSKTQAKQSLGIDSNVVNEIPNDVTEVKINTDIKLSDSEIEAINALTCSLDNPDACEACSG